MEVPDGWGSVRVVCPKCGAKVRIKRKESAANSSVVMPPDGFIRFQCPCGRRLKVEATNPPEFGQCPDCLRVVPIPPLPTVPTVSPRHPETPTEELSAEDLMALARWAQSHNQPAPSVPGPGPAGETIEDLTVLEPVRRMEAGLRVCPSCGKPVHLGAAVCRWCGVPVPKK